LYVSHFLAAPDYVARKMALHAEHGQRKEALGPDEVAPLDPVFAPDKQKLADAVRDLTDQGGDSRLFTERLADVCREKLDVGFRVGTRVTGLVAQGDRVIPAVTDAGPVTADTFVLALGVQSPIVARTIGVRLQVY